MEDSEYKMAQQESLQNVSRGIVFGYLSSTFGDDIPKKVGTKEQVQTWVTALRKNGAPDFVLVGFFDYMMNLESKRAKSLEDENKKLKEENQRLRDRLSVVNDIEDEIEDFVEEPVTPEKKRMRQPNFEVRERAGMKTGTIIRKKTK